MNGLQVIREWHVCQASFSQLGNSGNSAISVKGKGLTNAKIYLERNFFSKVQIEFQGHQVPNDNSAADLALIFFINILFLRWHKMYYCRVKNSHEQFLITYFNILAFVNSLSNFNKFRFEQWLAVSILHNIGRNARIA